MKLERQFWTDAMQETIRPEIDLQVNVGSYAVVAGMIDASWYDTKSTPSPYSTGAEDCYYNNMLNGNGFKIGDNRCVLNDGSGASYSPNIETMRATVSKLSTGTDTLMLVSASNFSTYGIYSVAGFQPVHRMRLWNVKDVTLIVEAVDNVSLTANVLDTATVSVSLADYADEYVVNIDLLDLFPNWDERTYHGVRLSYNVPSGDRLIYAGYIYPYDCYMRLGVQDIVSIKANEELELISGEVPHQTIELTIYDETGMYDPQNPDGQYDRIVAGLTAVFNVGIDGAFISPTLLYSTGDVSYNKHQLTIEFDTKWQSKKGTSYKPATFVGNIGDSLQQYAVWAIGSYNNSLSNYKTNAVTADPQWEGELDQLKLSSVGAFAIYNETYSLSASRIAFKATQLKSLIPQDYHVTARDMKDSHATLDRKPQLGDIKVSKYNYYISSESKSVSATGASPTPVLQVVVNLPEWCRHGARFEMITLSAVDIDGNTIPQSSLNWTIQESVTFGVQIYVSHQDNTTRLVSASLTGTIYYWTQEAINVKSEEYSSSGEECAIDNPFVTTDAQVNAIIDSVKYIYGQRDVFTAQWAQDWRVELGDIIYLDTQFESNVKVVVTGLKFSYPGLWGEITMRRLG